ncbi:MAG: hypothetical protein CSA84_01160 [Actinomycetales bacterium]|nr:MAG: hypothetical protein CSA84_01160 [Actinomycetales bacterium]
MRRLPGRWGGSWPDRIEVWGPTIGYLLVTVAGASTSSMGMPMLRQDPAHPIGRQWGDPQPIRSDEWLAASPLDLGVLINGGSTHSPLAQDPDLIYQTSSGGFFETLFFAEGNLLRLGPWLPDAMLFAAFRAFPTLLLLLTLPPLLRRLGATRPLSWLAVVLVIAAPASVWWSFMPTRIMAFASAGSYLLVIARDMLAEGRKTRGILIAIVAGGSLARLASYYVPWSLVIGLPIALATVLWLVVPRAGRRPAIASLGVGAAAGALLLAGTWWENLPALQAELSTAYPGLRRSTGMPMDPYQLFGAPGLFELQNRLPPLLHNASEVTSAFAICAVWAVLLLPALRGSPALEPGRRAVLWALGGSLAVWLAWTMLPWGSIGSNVPLLNLVTPIRATQTLGYLAVLLLVLVLSQVRPPGPSARYALLCAVVCAAVTAIAVLDLRRALPTLSMRQIVLTTVVTGLLILVVSRWRAHWLPPVAVAVVTGWAGLSVNPVLFGLGDLRASPAAGLVRSYEETAVSGGEQVLFASDDLALNALLVANGVPSLSGYQVTGPVREQWSKLDPTGSQEFVWNRGASYLRFDFSGAPGRPPKMSNAAFDVIVVAIDPCQLVPQFGLTHVLTFDSLDVSCATLRDTTTWSGRPAFLYGLSTA